MEIFGSLAVKCSTFFTSVSLPLSVRCLPTGSVLWVYQSLKQLEMRVMRGIKNCEVGGPSNQNNERTTTSHLTLSAGLADKPHHTHTATLTHSAC